MCLNSANYMDNYQDRTIGCTDTICSTKKRHKGDSGSAISRNSRENEMKLGAAALKNINNMAWQTSAPCHHHRHRRRRPSVSPPGTMNRRAFQSRRQQTLRRMEVVSAASQTTAATPSANEFPEIFSRSASFSFFAKRVALDKLAAVAGHKARWSPPELLVIISPWLFFSRLRVKISRESRDWVYSARGRGGAAVRAPPLRSGGGDGGGRVGALHSHAWAAAAVTPRHARYQELRRLPQSVGHIHQLLYAVCGWISFLCVLPVLCSVVWWFLKSFLNSG